MRNTVGSVGVKPYVILLLKSTLQTPKVDAVIVNWSLIRDPNRECLWWSWEFITSSIIAFLILQKLFLDNLRKALAGHSGSRQLTESAAIACVKLCKASTYISWEDNSVIFLLVQSMVVDLKVKKGRTLMNYAKLCFCGLTRPFCMCINGFETTVYKVLTMIWGKFPEQSWLVNSH